MANNGGHAELRAAAPLVLNNQCAALRAVTFDARVCVFQITKSMYFEKGKQMKGACETGVTRRCERVQIQTAISKFKFKPSNVTVGGLALLRCNCHYNVGFSCL